MYVTDLANNDGVSPIECMTAARHSVSANAAYQQSITKSECNRYIALGIEENEVLETSVPTIKYTSTTPTTKIN